MFKMQVFSNAFKIRPKFSDVSPTKDTMCFSLLQTEYKLSGGRGPGVLPLCPLTYFTMAENAQEIIQN